MNESRSGILALFKELFAVLRQLPTVEVWWRSVALHRAVMFARQAGGARAVRSSQARQLLRRVISATDRRLPGGGNCVRRALLEIALDGGAAREALCAGFRTGGGPGSGHAWLESEPSNERFDAVIRI